MDNKNIPITVIVGPTASGKTALSVKLAKEIDAEIVSADSMQVYKGMDIATAKPTLEEMDNVVHHLIGCIDVSQRFSVADYVKMANECIFDIISRGKNVILVGGTGLYVNSLIDNISFDEEEENSALRSELYKKAEQFGNEYMLNMLSELDCEYAKKLHPNNLTRIIRGIEINLLFNHTMQEHLELSKKEKSPYNPLMLGINYVDRQVLYDRINLRVDVMMQNGLLFEAKSFFNKLDEDKTAVQAIGYKELFPYINGDISLEMALENLKKATRNYAKRQLTWFKKDEKINWLYADVLSKDELFNNALNMCVNHLNTVDFKGV